MNAPSVQASCLLAPHGVPRLKLERAAREARIVVFCGIPGVGKSLLLREQLTLARAAGRRVTRLQWDVCRQSFELPEILARYPEVGGTTHVTIRRAVGLWARPAIAAWAAAHASEQDLLVIEAPLVGGRLAELAESAHDAAEPLLASNTTRCFVPTPTRAVRHAIERARRVEMASHRHARDAANASPEVVDELWRLVASSARALGLVHSESGARSLEYLPELYFAVYRHVLKHRPVEELPIEEIVQDPGSPHATDADTEELAPNPSQVHALIERAATEGETRLAARAERWYET